LVINTPHGQQVALNELFDIAISYRNPQNQHFFNNDRGILLAIYSQPNADLFELQEDIFRTLDLLKKDFPTVNFVYSQDQIHLLRANINQLYATAGLAIVFAFIVFFISSKSRRLPLILGMVIPSSILISIGILWTLGFTLNIITLSGFILGIGLLVDNVIILIEEINQQKKAGSSIKMACITSVKNIFPALLSSTLTTICVFIPLLALGGIASELFKEQAIALIVILGVSLMLSFILIPTFYTLLIKNEIADLTWIIRFRSSIHHKSKLLNVAIVSTVVVFGSYAAIVLVPQNLPEYATSNYQMKISWNEPISLMENRQRVEEITNELNPQFISSDLGISGISTNEISFFDEANLYIETNEKTNLKESQEYLYDRCKQLYPRSTISFYKATNPFEMIFYDKSPLAEARVRKTNGGFFNREDLSKLESISGEGSIQTQLAETYKISFNKERIENVSVDYSFIASHLKNLTDERLITSIKKTDQSIPVTLSNNDLTYFIKRDSLYLDMAYFYDIKDTAEIKKITADLSGPYISY
ncbi:MAG: efflux RND transporter permease subunit, partial [Bacteroidota bacterium]